MTVGFGSRTDSTNRWRSASTAVRNGPRFVFLQTRPGWEHNFVFCQLRYRPGGLLPERLERDECLTGETVLVTVSVVLPAYNAAADLSAAIASVQSQSFADFEVIVVDDASVDETPELVARISRRDARIRSIRNEVNLGPAGARNAGIAAARGEWIALLDSDDTFEPARLSYLLGVAGDCGADMVSDDLRLIDPDGAVRRLLPAGMFAPARLMPFKEFVDGCYYDKDTQSRSLFVFMHPMLRAQFLRDHGLRYEVRSRNGEDFLLYLDCLTAGARWAVAPEAYYNYSVRGGSLTETVADADRVRIIDKLAHLLTAPAIIADASLAGAIERHRLSVERQHFYGLVRDRLKSGRVGAAVGIVLGNPAAFGFFLRELRGRAPGIFRTALRKFRGRAATLAEQRS